MFPWCSHQPRLAKLTILSSETQWRTSHHVFFTFPSSGFVFAMSHHDIYVSEEYDVLYDVMGFLFPSTWFEITSARDGLFFFFFFFFFFFLFVYNIYGIPRARIGRIGQQLPIYLFFIFLSFMLLFTLGGGLTHTERARRCLTAETMQYSFIRLNHDGKKQIKYGIGVLQHNWSIPVSWCENASHTKADFRLFMRHTYSTA